LDFIRSVEPRIRCLLVAAVVAFGCASIGCATIDLDYPRTPSSALSADETSQTHLGREIHASLAGRPSSESGFYLVRNGIDSLALRLLIADTAERTIDAQYYVVEDDVVGSAFIEALLDAADRGVRVRLLIDDMFTTGYDAAMAGLDTHPNFEIRVFNPFEHRQSRLIDGLTSFPRINRRMHNKSFTVDSQVTIIGGRNIADEYFAAQEDVNFFDLDVLAIGPVVSDISRMFDAYWNHPTAVPVPGFADLPEDPESQLLALRERLARRRETAAGTPYALAVKRQVRASVEMPVATAFTWAPYRLVFDSPDKGIKARSEDAPSIRPPLIESLESAKNELIVVSPYFVPLASGVERFSEIQKRGVKVSIVTNSLAANDQKLVYGGYAPSRKPLLQQEVRIFEVRSDGDVSGAQHVAEASATTLHMKAFVVDRRELFVGSFNFDPRSAYINTELGVIIESPKLAEFIASIVEEALPSQSWEAFLNEDGKLRWRGLLDGEEVVLDKEPQTTFWDRFTAGFYRLLPIRGQL
jgi:putative cardiolipin synthase